MVNLNIAPPGLDPIRQVNFRSPNPSPVVGVDPGRGNVFTFHEAQPFESHIDSIQRHKFLHQVLKSHYGDRCVSPSFSITAQLILTFLFFSFLFLPIRYVLSPFGLSSKAYHHHIGTYRYQRQLFKLKLERNLLNLALSTMTCKVSTSAALRNSLTVQAQHHWPLILLYTDKKLAKAKFEIFQRKQRFLGHLEFSLKVRFPSSPIFAYGSAAVNPTRFKGHPATPVKAAREAFVKLFRCVATPEFYTSQK